jgi:hypothetical protein
MTYASLFFLSLLYILFKHAREWSSKTGRLAVPSITVEAEDHSHDPISLQLHSRRRSNHFGLPPLAPIDATLDLEPGSPTEETLVGGEDVMKRSRSRSRSINLAGRFTSPGGIRMDTLATEESGVTFVDTSIVPVPSRIVSGQEQDRADKELRWRFVRGVASDVGHVLIGAGLTWWLLLNLDWLF